MNKFDTLWLALVIILCPIHSTHAGYDQHPKSGQFIEEVEEEYQIPEADVKHWLSKAKKIQSVLDAIQRPAERTKKWHEYRRIFLTEKRIKQGREFLKEHAQLLGEAERHYGVSKEIIAAIIGIETFYGRRQGNYRVLDSLATLAFDYPERPLFWRELKAFFSLIKQEKLNPESLKGSYAGAMGYGQFIPTSFLRYAVDGDGDGKRDLWRNPADAIHSVANYFKRHGWHPSEGITQRVRVRGEDYRSIINKSRKPQWTVAELKQLGVTPTHPVDDEKAVTLMRFQGRHGAEFWLGQYNFYVITRYNHSRLYAMAVFQLSKALTTGRPVN